MNSKRLFAPACLLPAAIFVTYSTFAADDSGRQPEVIVVSAARTGMDLSRVASSVTVLDRQYLDQRQSVYLADILRDVPGLSVNRSGSAGGITEVRSRGGEANQLLVLVDGIRANDPAANDQFQWQTLTTYDIERVEIVRGPQSAVWGSDANTGVINIITRRDTAGFSGGGFVEGGSYDSLSGGLNASGNGEQFDWALNGSYLEQDSFNNAQQGSEDDPFSNSTLSARLAFRPGANSSVGLTTRYTEADARTDWQDCLPGPGNDPCPQRVSDSLPDKAESSQLYTGLSGEIAFFDRRWSHQLLLASTDTESRSVFQFRDFFDPDALVTDEFRTDGSLREVRYQTNWDFARAGEASGADVVTFAVDYQERAYANSAGVDDATRQTGYVVEGHTLLTDALSLTGSLRYDDNSDYDDVATWRVTAGYDIPATGTRLRGAAGTGQKAPTTTELFGFFPGFVGNPDLDPERSEGWELGFDQQLPVADWQLAFTYFAEDLKNQIVNISLPDFSSSVANAPDETRRAGVEIGLTGQLAEQLTGRLAYTYLDSDAVLLAGTEVLGRAREIRRPRNSLALNLNYRFLADRANLNLNVAYTDAQLDNVFLSDFSVQRAELDSYTIVALAGEYDVTPAFTVYGRVDNLLDEDYEEVYSYNTVGRAAYLGMRMSLQR